MLNIYLAHPFDSRDYVREMELQLEAQCGVNIVNPFYDLTRDDIEAIDSGRQSRCEANYVQIVERDLTAIACSDGVIAVVDGALSYGTIMEIFAAANVYGLPVILYCTNGHHDHPWLRYHAERVVQSYDGIVWAIEGLKLGVEE